MQSSSWRIEWGWTGGGAGAGDGGGDVGGAGGDGGGNVSHTKSSDWVQKVVVEVTFPYGLMHSRVLPCVFR